MHAFLFADQAFTASLELWYKLNYTEMQARWPVYSHPALSSWIKRDDLNRNYAKPAKPPTVNSIWSTSDDAEPLGDCHLLLSVEVSIREILAFAQGAVYDFQDGPRRCLMQGLWERTTFVRLFSVVGCVACLHAGRRIWVGDGDRLVLVVVESALVAAVSAIVNGMAGTVSLGIAGGTHDVRHSISHDL